VRQARPNCDHLPARRLKPSVSAVCRSRSVSSIFFPAAGGAVELSDRRLCSPPCSSSHKITRRAAKKRGRARPDRHMLGPLSPRLLAASFLSTHWFAARFLAGDAIVSDDATSRAS
jgi:hypothetical protein